MSDTLRKYEERFKKPIPMPAQVEEESVIKVAAEYLVKGKPIPDNFDWWEALPDKAYT